MYKCTLWIQKRCSQSSLISPAVAHFPPDNSHVTYPSVSTFGHRLRLLDSPMPSERSLYLPYRALGLVCDGPAAPVLHRQGTATFLTTPVSAGRALHLYDIQLQLKLVSKPFPAQWPSTPVTCIAAAHDFTFCALSSGIGVLKRLQPVVLWTLHEECISHLVIVGDILVSVCRERVAVWSIPSSAKRAVDATGDVLADIALPPEFVVSAITHPSTYVNKILIGAKDGKCLLINLRTKKIVHEFEGFGARVNCLEPSPVLDVVAAGLEDGRIVLHNIRVDETIMTFRHAEDKERRATHAVHHLAFRTDGDESLVSADAEGNFFVWDLNERLVRSEAYRVHVAGASLAEFLPGEPVLVTTGADNAVKIHIFDAVGGEARVLRSREGHSLPPTIVRFCGYDGSMMVSAGLDRKLRLVSTVREARNRSFAQKNVGKRGARAKKRRRIEATTEKGEQRSEMYERLPPIIAIAATDIRERDEDFANIVTIHDNTNEVYTWRMQNGATHGIILSPPKGPEEYKLAFRREPKSSFSEKQKSKKKVKAKEEQKSATCAVLSPCGNYAVIGSQDGRLHCYNLQSGRHQGVYEDPALPFNLRTKKVEENEEAKPIWKKAHASAVVATAVDAFGDNLISAGRTDSLVKFWSLYARSAAGDPIATRAKIAKIEWCKTSDLLAISCIDFNIYIYDGATRRLARKFSAHTAPISDFCFDPNGRRLVSASVDGTIRTWDLPSGRLIDTRSCQNAPTSIAVAPSGEYVATTHINNLGISMWVDASKFRSLLVLEKSNGEGEDNTTTADLTEMEDEANESGSIGSGVKTEPFREEARNGKGKETALTNIPNQLSKQTATLSSKPLTHWSTLSNLQAIKERNKPIEPPKKPASAPFFLPTVKGLQFKFDVNQNDETKIKESKNSKKKRGRRSQFVAENEKDTWTNSKFGRLVAKEQYMSAAELLRKQDASGVDLEIQTLEGRVSRQNAARFFKEQLMSPQEFELTQAHLGLFLRAHGMDLAKDEEGEELIDELLRAHHEAWGKLRETLSSVTTLSSYFATDV